MLVSQQNDSVIHVFQITFPYRLLQNTEYNFLCYMVGWLSILNIVGKCSILINSMHYLKACLNTMSVWTLLLVRWFWQLKITNFKYFFFIFFQTFQEHPVALLHPIPINCHSLLPSINPERKWVGMTHTSFFSSSTSDGWHANWE